MGGPLGFSGAFRRKLSLAVFSKAEPILFILFVVAGLVNIWSSEFFLSLDGPAHIHNAKLFDQIDHNPFLQQYYFHSSFYLPNYFSTIALNGLMHFFDAIVSEKLLISFIVTFIPITFRAMVFTIQPEKTVYTSLIFFLPFSKLLYVGFYNFMVAFVFLNVSIILFYHLLRNGWSVALFLLTTINAIVLYYSHALIFALSGLTILLLLVFENSKTPKRIFSMALKLFLMYGIPLLMYVLFVTNFSIPDYDYDSQKHEKVEALLTYHSGITFLKEQEMVNTAWVPVLLVFLAGVCIGTRKRENGLRTYFRVSDVFVLISLTMICLIFNVKDGQFGGMFIQRLVYICFYFVIIWLLCNLKNSNSLFLLCLSIVIYVYVRLSLDRHQYTSQFNEYINGVRSVETYIQNNSLVFALVLSDIWHFKHISGYLGLNKALVLNDNYEAILDWFPIRFNKDVIYPYQGALDFKTKEIHYPDYVYIFGDTALLRQDKYLSSWLFLEKNAKHIFSSSDKNSHLYKVIEN